MIDLENVTIAAGEFELQNITLHIPKGEYVVLMGKTGCGKSTILEVICGLRKTQSGKVLLQGTDVTDWSPADRGIGYVPQDLALFPTLSVFENIAFALNLRKKPKAAVKQRVGELADVLGIESLLGRRVTHLSGGESQRVALGRALSFEPPVLLLDEPLSALDESTREEIQELLIRIKKQTGVTTLHVTHSKSEAAALADRQLVLADGAISQYHESTHSKA